MRIAFIGDVVGEIGVKALSSFLPSFRKREAVDFVIVNGENSYHNGKGMGHLEYKAIKEAGADCITLGNHFASNEDALDLVKYHEEVLRPHNLEGYRGNGSGLFEVKGKKIRVSVVLGNAFVKPESLPHIVSLEDLSKMGDSDIHILDFHGESTSEKSMAAHMYDGKFSAILGTHTHVQTSDCRKLDKGTIFMSDVGLTGYSDGVIGFDFESVYERIYGHTGSFAVPEKGISEVDGVIMDFEDGKFVTSFKVFREFVDVE